MIFVHDILLNRISGTYHKVYADASGTLYVESVMTAEGLEITINKDNGHPDYTRVNRYRIGDVVILKKNITTVNHLNPKAVSRLMGQRLIVSNVNPFNVDTVNPIDSTIKTSIDYEVYIDNDRGRKTLTVDASWVDHRNRTLVQKVV